MRPVIETWRETEIEQRGRPRVQPVLRKTQRSSHIGYRFLQSRGQRVRCAIPGVIDVSYDIQIGGRALDEPEKQHGAAADDRQSVFQSTAVQKLPKRFQSRFQG